MKFMPATNVIFGFLGGCLAYGLLQAAKHFGYECPPDIADGLPAASALAIAHVWDMYSGDNKKPPVPPAN